MAKGEAGLVEQASLPFQREGDVMTGLDRAVARLKEAATRPAMAEQELAEVFAHIEQGTPLNEMWSDAARAASAAARKARSRGGNWKKAATQAYYSKATHHPSADRSSVAMGKSAAKRTLKKKPQISADNLLKAMNAYTSRRMGKRKVDRANALYGR